jgi:hypothetical protein
MVNAADLADMKLLDSASPSNLTANRDVPERSIPGPQGHLHNPGRCVHGYGSDGGGRGWRGMGRRRGLLRLRLWRMSARPEEESS